MFDFSTGQLTWEQNKKNTLPLPEPEPLDQDSHLACMYPHAQEGSGQKDNSRQTCALCWENKVFGTESGSIAPSLWRKRNKREDEETLRPLLEPSLYFVQETSKNDPACLATPASIPYYPASSLSLGPETSGNDL